MNYLKDYREVFRVILRKLVNSLGLEIASVIIMQENTLEVLEANVRGRFVPVDNKKSEKRFKAAFTALKTGKPVVVRDVDNTVLFEKRTDEHVKNIVCFPFRVKNDIRGVFNLTNRKKKWDLKILEIAKLIIDQGIISIDNARLYEMAITDGLTGLYIHRFFQIRLSEELLRAQKNNISLSLVMFDIDHFKKFNDKYGHQTGDRVLETVSEVIRENIRKGIDTAARYGGEEFAVIIPETDCHGAYAFAERLREKISKKELYFEDKRLFVNVSLGVASYPVHAKTKTDIICKADNALYYSKEHGRNCSTIYSEECSNG
jgi:diguanylate cyclase (GGDEF)-like protein